ncbi:CUB_2 domain-containing protein [Caenorhabditis elegans]|nr:CUB_2 domain-containing protein [Caenorhabditis elegans]CCW46022.1 CUB_2 domain-containing protein [Caenorhabditis elegans]|eukprot:NP_001294712.1 Uncharacterized protein CELE_F53C11.1 [Caenorhabditis elegans]
MDVGESVFFAAANNSKVYISTNSGKASFYFSWQYIDVSKFTRIQNPTGTVLNLNLTANSFYQFVSSADQVAFHTSALGILSDSSIWKIYVYDGEDLNAKFMGNLKQFTNIGSSSTRKSLSLVNFYETPSQSYGIANDYSIVSRYKDYSLRILSSGSDFFERFFVPDGVKSAVTFFCPDSMETYITGLTIVKQNFPGEKFVSFTPLTPTHAYSNVLAYSVGDPIYRSLPQQILSDTFTMVAYQSAVSLSLTCGPYPNWGYVFPGRRGYIISPSIWNPTTLKTPSYSTNFTSSETVRFNINLPDVVIGDPGAKIRVEFGAPGKTPVGVEFNETTSGAGARSANATYMSVTFDGTTVKSSFSFVFNVESLFPSTSTTTDTPFETTTKSSAIIFKCSMVFIILVKFLNF